MAKGRHRRVGEHRFLVICGTVLAVLLTGGMTVQLRDTGPRLLFGLGTEADGAIAAPLTRQAPVRMLSSWYNGPADLAWMTRWRDTIVPTSYAAGYALHLIVWTGEPEIGGLSTPYGPACGRPYPLSARFDADMAELARTFGGPRAGPPLYVTLFTEFQTFACRDNSFRPDDETAAYYQALKDRWRAAYATFHRYAPNARVSLGWGGWQASFDDPATGGGRSMFGHFADLMRAADFQSFQAMDDTQNTDEITSMVPVLARYGPVMLAHYKPDNGSAASFDADVRRILTDEFLAPLVDQGLFAVSFMDDTYLTDTAPAYGFVRDAVTRYGRGW